MNELFCTVCQGAVDENAKFCPHCGAKFAPARNFREMTRLVGQSKTLKVGSGTARRVGWFLLANFAIVASISILSAGALFAYSPIFLIVSCFFPFCTLLFSRWLAKRSHRMRIIRKGQYQYEGDQSLYELVETLCKRANIRKMPEVGVYEDHDVNAFATGATRNRSLVAFSTALLETMDEEGIAGVAAHEISHIANGDMVTMSLVQSVVNALVYLITIPLKIVEWAAFFSDEVSETTYWIIAIIRMLVSSILFFLGSLVVLAFSRWREFKADRLAAQLLRKESMIHALELLRDEHPVVLKSQKAYAALKINGASRWLDLFSTHPSIDRRIRALQMMK